MTDPSRPFADKSDAELAAMERDKSLSVEQWTEVEAELGRRAKALGPTSQPGASIAAAADARTAQALAELHKLLIPGERLLAFAIQRRVFALTHRRVIVAATSGRFVGLTRGLFGGYALSTVRWQDLRDVAIQAGALGADLLITVILSDDLGSQQHVGGSRRSYMGLRKDEAQSVYKICQAQEQSWREKRRVRDLDELRAQSGGLQVAGISGSGAVSGLSVVDPTERLRRAKEMLDTGLISDAEYEAIKARVVDAL